MTREEVHRINCNRQKNNESLIGDREEIRKKDLPFQSFNCIACHVMFAEMYSVTQVKR